jgi:hypothetical protein
MVSIGADHNLLGSLILATWARSSASLLVRLIPNALTTPISPDHVSEMQLDDAFALDRDFALWCHAVKRFKRLLA